MTWATKLFKKLPGSNNYKTTDKTPNIQFKLYAGSAEFQKDILTGRDFTQDKMGFFITDTDYEFDVNDDYGDILIHAFEQIAFEPVVRGGVLFSDIDNFTVGRHFGGFAVVNVSQQTPYMFCPVDLSPVLMPDWCCTVELSKEGLLTFG